METVDQGNEGLVWDGQLGCHMDYYQTKAHLTISLAKMNQFNGHGAGTVLSRHSSVLSMLFELSQLALFGQAART